MRTSMCLVVCAVCSAGIWCNAFPFNAKSLSFSLPRFHFPFSSLHLNCTERNRALTQTYASIIHAFASLLLLLLVVLLFLPQVASSSHTKLDEFNTYPWQSSVMHLPISRQMQNIYIPLNKLSNMKWIA